MPRRQPAWRVGEPRSLEGPLALSRCPRDGRPCPHGPRHAPGPPPRQAPRPSPHIARRGPRPARHVAAPIRPLRVRRRGEPRDGAPWFRPPLLRPLPPLRARNGPRGGQDVARSRQRDGQELVETRPLEQSRAWRRHQHRGLRPPRLLRLVRLAPACRKRPSRLARGAGWR